MYPVGVRIFGKKVRAMDIAIKMDIVVIRFVVIISPSCCKKSYGVLK